VDERVIAAAVGRNEAIALGFVEKFDCADWHLIIPSLWEAERRPLQR
jgi:hypothetical protein